MRATLYRYLIMPKISRIITCVCVLEMSSHCLLCHCMLGEKSALAAPLMHGFDVPYGLLVPRVIYVAVSDLCNVKCLPLVRLICSSE
jgi:hypothetical protein